MSRPFVNVVPQALDSDATFTRPADTTAYASGDLVANSTTAGSVVPLSFLVARDRGGFAEIHRVRLYKTTNTTSNASFRLHLFNELPTVSAGDNAAYTSTQGLEWIGKLDITVDQAFTTATGAAGSAGIGVPASGTTILAKSDTNNDGYIYGLLEARAGYSPGNAEIFYLTLEGLKI